MKLINMTLLLFAFFGCDKASEMIKGTNDRIYIKPNGQEIATVRVIDWKVGSNFKEEVSKGISVSLRLPIFSEEDLRFIYSSRGANSFIIRINRKGYYGESVIGHAYLPFLNEKNGSRKFYKPKGATINIFYAAAAISKRFENFYCPAFNHNKIVTETKINDLATNVSDQMIISPIEESRYSVRIVKLNYAPFVINGGSSITDEYSFEVAFYDFQNKRTKSNFIKIPQTLKVVSEQEVRLKGCQGFEIPPKKDGPQEGKFKFGR